MDGVDGPLEAPKPTPNVVLVVADGLGFSDPGCHGGAARSSSTPGSSTGHTPVSESSAPTAIDDRMRTVGHRGASSLAPENTVRAIRVAIEYRLDFVEVDVHLAGMGNSWFTMIRSSSTSTESGCRSPS